MIRACFVLVLHTALTSQTQLSATKAVTSCSLESDGKLGLCVPLTECPLVWENVQKRNETVFCGIAGRVPIVCCSSEATEQSFKAAQALSYDSYTTGSSQSNTPISERKCREYAKLVYEGDSKVEKCSIRPNGKKLGHAFYGEFPHMASLMYEEEDTQTRSHFCGGALISERFVLTAAHCLISYDSRFKWVLLGAVNLTNTSTGQLMPISQTTVHHDYRTGIHYFDVGLVKLKRAPVLGPFLRPACLPSQNEIFSSRKIIVAGWGVTDFFAEELSTDLLKGVVFESPLHVCSRIFKSSKNLLLGIHEESMMCVIPPTANAGTCKGDSGGPSQVISTNHYCMYEISGIISFGKGCGLKNTPEVHQRVQYYRKWIENIVWA